MLEQPVIQLKRGFARRQSVQIEDFWVDFLVTVQKRYCLNCKIARRHSSPSEGEEEEEDTSRNVRFCNACIPG